ncbi:MAG: IF-2-associated domain-containing protein, partial [Pseudomonadota bacterium]|nr:IF-2-associated domain-containing protein [Pseudomonadota bacterium]
MSDIKRDAEKTLSVGKTLSLKRPSVEQGVVRQSFSHGRSKAVVVETKKRRIVKPGQDGRTEAGAEAAPAAAAPAAAPRPR